MRGILIVSYAVSLLVLGWILFAAVFSTPGPANSLIYRGSLDPANFSPAFPAAVLKSGGFRIFGSVKVMMISPSVLGVLVQLPLLYILAFGKKKIRSGKNINRAAWFFLFFPHVLLIVLAWPLI